LVVVALGDKGVDKKKAAAVIGGKLTVPTENAS
jgi:hypothetical protein